MMRDMLNMMALMMRGPKYEKWAKKVSVKKMDIGGPKFHKGATRRYALLAQPKGTEQMKNRKCMLYFHGGGAVGGSPEMM